MLIIYHLLQMPLTPSSFCIVLRLSRAANLIKFQSTTLRPISVELMLSARFPTYSLDLDVLLLNLTDTSWIPIRCFDLNIR